MEEKAWSGKCRTFMFRGRFPGGPPKCLELFYKKPSNQYKHGRHPLKEILWSWWWCRELYSRLKLRVSYFPMSYDSSVTVICLEKSISADASTKLLRLAKIIAPSDMKWFQMKHLFVNVFWILVTGVILKPHFAFKPNMYGQLTNKLSGFQCKIYKISCSCIRHLTEKFPLKIQ